MQTKVFATTGRLSNEHFLLCAEHLEMEVEVGSFSLIRAMGRGNIEIYVQPEREGQEYVILAESATYSVSTRELQVAGWKRTRVNGIEKLRDRKRWKDVLLVDEGAGLVSASAAWEKHAA